MTRLVSVFLGQLYLLSHLLHCITVFYRVSETSCVLTIFVGVVDLSTVLVEYISKDCSSNIVLCAKYAFVRAQAQFICGDNKTEASDLSKLRCTICSSPASALLVVLLFR